MEKQIIKQNTHENFSYFSKECLRRIARDTTEADVRSEQELLK